MDTDHLFGSERPPEIARFHAHFGALSQRTVFGTGVLETALCAKDRTISGIDGWDVSAKIALSSRAISALIRLRNAAAFTK
jgi:hypothetical protein